VQKGSQLNQIGGAKLARNGWSTTQGTSAKPRTSSRMWRRIEATSFDEGGRDADERGNREKPPGTSVSGTEGEPVSEGVD